MTRYEITGRIEGIKGPHTTVIQAASVDEAWARFKAMYPQRVSVLVGYTRLGEGVE